MAQSAAQSNGMIIRDFLSVADLLEQPSLARVYTYLYLEGDSTVAELMDALDLAQETAYSYVNRLT